MTSQTLSAQHQSGAQLQPGFTDPVLDSQAVFRCLLRALSYPGQIQTIPSMFAEPPPLPPAMAALALTLFDLETPILLIRDEKDGDQRDTVHSWLNFHTGAPFAASADKAAFALIAAGVPLPAFGDFSHGDAQYPEQAATLIIDLPALSGGVPKRLRGPGIDRHITVEPDVAPDFWQQWQDNAANYPLGIDIFLTSGWQVMGLPRGVVQDD